MDLITWLAIKISALGGMLVACIALWSTNHAIEYTDLSFNDAMARFIVSVLLGVGCLIVDVVIDKKEAVNRGN